MIVTGDPTQVDLPRGERSGLVEALALLEGVEGVHITRFSDKDVVRHALVGRIVRAYEADTAKRLAAQQKPEPQR
jgi:phosphate starvation-inducible PhoH-like protein